MKRLLGLAIATIALAAPTTASAGTYDVSACFGGALGNGSWAPESSQWGAAYTACPGEGVVARMSGGPGTAPLGGGARQVFTAPPTTAIVRLRARINQGSTRGWWSGLVDSSLRWIWGGPNATTWGQYWAVDLPTRTQQLFSQVTCGDAGGCPRSAQYGFVNMQDVVVTVEDNVRPGIGIIGGSVTADGWHRGSQDVRFDARDWTGIRSVDVLVDGVKRGTSLGQCNIYASRPCSDLANALPTQAEHFVGEGPHTVTVRAFDGAWNFADASRQIYVDNVPPAQPLDGALVGGDLWRSRNDFKITWQNPRQAGASIAAAHYRICPALGGADDVSPCSSGVRRGNGLTSLSGLTVPRRGAWKASVWLEDAAGNEEPEHSITLLGLKLDMEPPTLAFEASKGSDPARVSVAARDSTSAVAEAWIEARRQGENAWRSLPTVLDQHGFSAVLDDERLPKGRYDLRARAKDLAGNERTIDSDVDGAAARRTLPIRLGTRLVVGKPTRVRARGTNGKRRYRTALVVHPRAHYGHTIPLSGRLTTPGANPLADADVEVWERVKLPSATWRRVAQLRTSRRGRFKFKALSGPSRSLRFRYPGTATIRARSTVVDLKVRALTTLYVTKKKVVNGEEVRFHGRLKGKQRGAIGKLINLQVYTRGRWSTFATPRAQRRTGRWSVPYRFTATRGAVTYRFRALVPREAAFPYEAGSSRAVRVAVRGL